MSVIFFTGFPGFLGRELLPRVLLRETKAQAVCLVQAKFDAVAQEALKNIEDLYPYTKGRITMVHGDITVPGLGLTSKANELNEKITSIYHLAAVYDLMVKRETGMRINVDGTKHVLEFAQSCKQLNRLHYISTCYVSGRYTGPFFEDDLEKGQTFNNYYEETKHLAEVLVRKAMLQGLPVTIYRPSIVVGDSQNGQTQKYDGPYFMIQWLLRQPKQLAFLPIVGDPSLTRLNVVPRDFVVESIAYLSGLKSSLGKTYQLADPNPLTIDEMVNLIGEMTERKIIRVPLPLTMVRFFLDRVPGVYSWVRIPSDLIPYLVHPTHYDTRNASADLVAAEITCPNLKSYMPQLVQFVRTNPNISSNAMI